MMNEDNTMVNRPTDEQAKFLFEKFPNRTLREWGAEWGLSHERVRQIKEKVGIPPRGVFNQQIANEIVEYIRSGKGTLNTPRTYANYPSVGKARFQIWMNENPSLKAQVEVAVATAKDRRLNPTHKKCATTGKTLPISEFYKDSNTMDGYSVRSKEAVKAQAKKYYDMRNVEVPTVTEKYCSGVPELGKLPAEEFGKNVKSASGLQTYCKPFLKKYQTLIKSKQLGKFDGDAFEGAKEFALQHYAEQGIYPNTR